MMKDDNYPGNLVIAAKQKLEERDYWLKKLSGELAKSYFFYDKRTVNKEEKRIDVLEFKLQGDIFSKLIKLSKSSDHTLHMILAAALELLLHKYTGNRDIIICTPIYEQDTQAEFINTVLVLRNRVEENLTFKELLLQVRETIIEATENYSYPVELLMEELNIPLFDMAILVENIHDKEYLQHIHLNMIFSFKRTNRCLEGCVEYNALLYEKPTMERIVKHFHHLLNRVLFNIDIPVSEVEIIPGEEKKRLLFDFNNTAVEFPANKTIHELVEEQVDKTPNHLAAVIEDRQLTYGELNKKANRLARALRKKGVGGDIIVGIMTDHSLEMIIGILGVLKAGGAYFPIDRETPVNRVISMLNDCGVPVLITQSNILKKYSFKILKNFQVAEVKPYLTAPRPQVPDFDKIPIPNRSLVNYEKYSQHIGVALAKNVVSLQATRGCPYMCAYCHKIWPKTHIYRSAEHIFAEVRQLYELGVRRFAIIDDIFNLVKKNSMRFFEIIIKKGLKLQLFFPAGMRGDILTKDYIDLLVEAGLVCLPLALETGSPRLQKLIKKNLNLERFRENIEYFCQKHPHVILDLFTMHGFPTETEKEAMMTLNFIKGIKWLHFPYIFILHIYPGTDMEKLALDSGITGEAIVRSKDLYWHELPETLPFSKSFTKNYQAQFLNEYFLCKERLLHVLSYQMAVLTEEEILQKYKTYLPADLKCLHDLLEFAGIGKDELDTKALANAKGIPVVNLNEKIKKAFPAPWPFDNALRVLLLDLSQFFSRASDPFNELVEPPLGLMYIMTYLKQQFGKKINGKIAKSRIDFDNYRELKELLDEFKPDVIGIRTLTYYENFFHETVALIRAWGMNAPIISGGPYATSSYSTILQDRNVDLVVLGEGEITFAQLVGKIMENNGKLPGQEVLKQIAGIAFIPDKPGIKRKSAREIFLMDIPGWEVKNESQGKNLERINQSTDLAYVIFTSGSTGKPRGVGIEHRGVVNMLLARKQEYKMNAKSTSLQLFSYAFDGFVTSFFTPVISGSKVVLPEKKEIGDISKIRDAIVKNSVTHFIGVPSLYSAVIGSMTAGDVSTLKAVTLAGEDVSLNILASSVDKSDTIEIVNEYGVTESSVLSTIYRHQQNDNTVKIGKPIWNTMIYIVDKHRTDRIQPIGVPGEMCIAGAGLARGYINNPELTAERFHFFHYRSYMSYRTYISKKVYSTGDLARWLPDGNLQYLGRIDHQVKIRGFRIELGEIEEKLKAHESIKEAVVVVQEDKVKDKYLAAYYVEQPKKDNLPQLWPSVAEFFVYDDLLYYAMSHDERRNKSYKVAINRLVKDKVVLDIGTGKDVILARFCVEAGAKKVYAVELLEETYKKAKKTVKELGLEQKIILIHGDATTIQIPEKVDVCVSEIVGAIGGCEGAAVILNKCRRLLKKQGIMIPTKSITRIAAVSLPDEIRKNPGFTQTPGNYVEKIFKHVEYSFDLRVCVKNFPLSHVISNADNFEYLDFTGRVPEESIDKIILVIHKDARIEGFLVWLNLYTLEHEIIDILKHEHCWLPVFVPVFYPGIEVLKGDRVEAECIRTPGENKINPDYKIKGTLIRKNKKNIEFEYDLPHFERAYRKSPFYQKLFEDGSIKIIKSDYRKLRESELRNYLSKHLPGYMIPAYFIGMDNIPRTPSGKVDRKALPSPMITGEKEILAPRNTIERKLVKIWQEVLGLRDSLTGIDDNFFELGGHSLKATTLISKIHQVLEVELPLTEVFKKQTIRKLAEYIQEAGQSKYVGIEPVEKKEYYTLSSAQRRMYFLQQLINGPSGTDMNGVAYNIPLVLFPGSDIKKDKLETALKKLVARHESLRTSFHMIDGMPVQRVHDEVKFEIEFYDLATEETEDTERKNYKQITNKKETKGHHSSFIIHNSFIVRPFDLSQAPLLRSGLIKLPDGNHIWIVDIHHIISDGTSHSILTGDFISLYNGKGLEPLRLHYKDFSQWQNRLFENSEIKSQEDYWLELYRDHREIPRLTLPTDHKRPAVFTFVGDRYHFVLEGEEAMKFKALAANIGGTLYMNILAALNTLFYKYTGQTDIIIGTGIAGRPHTDLQRIIGMFVNTVAMRNYPKPGKTYEFFLKEVIANSIQAFENQDVQFEDLVDKLDLERNPSRNPLFDISMVVQDFMDLPQLLPANENLPPPDIGFKNTTTKFDMTFFIYESEEDVHMDIEYYTGIFKKETIQRLVTHFKNVIAAVTKQPSIKPPDIDILSEEEKEQILNEFNDTAKSYPKDKTIHQLFADQVEKTPDNTAIVGPLPVKYRTHMTHMTYITYKELNQKSNQLAGYLHYEKHLQPEEPVGILMSSSLVRPIAIIGVLESGGVYVPIDPSLPLERIKYIINDAGIGTVISEKKHIKTLNRLQWECSDFHSYLCIDSLDIYAEEEHETNQLMDRELWHHIGKTAINDITAGGWVSSYTGEPLSKAEMDEYGDNILKKLEPLLHPKMKVLEIGCASGISMYRIAPKVGLYYGTDLSKVIIDKNKKTKEEQDLRNIKLTCIPAHEIDGIEEKNFDLIIMNSVIQCFHGHHYLRKVIGLSIDLLAESGYLFIGDIMDQEKKDTMIRELEAYKRTNARNDTNYTTKTDFSSELFVPKGFWQDMAAQLDVIRDIKFSDKFYTIENELTKFRYDALITINKRTPGNKRKKWKNRKYQDDARVLARMSSQTLHLSILSQRAAYIIYTSGTTGKPKGVMITHRSLVNLCKWHNRNYHVTAADHATLYAGFGFDASVWELFPYLITGSCLYMISDSLKLDAAQLNHYFERNDITIGFLPTQFCQQFTRYENRSLRVLLTGGDKLRTVTGRNYALYNNYGPTENTVVTTAYLVEKVGDSIPIGKPIDNHCVFILNRKGTRLQPVNVPGELCISGIGLARGYINHPELTAKNFCLRRPGGRFLEKTAPLDPPQKLLINKSYRSYIYHTGDLARWLSDGNIEFLGRIDQQVKIRGYRIETGEIESQLKKHQDIDDTVVLAKEREQGDQYLYAYIVFAPERELAAAQLKEYLLNTLPDYMIPSYFIHIDKIPLTPGGKVDRKQLPEPGLQGAAGYAAPLDSLEKKLVQIWSEVLTVQRDVIGIHHNFFEIGGHSLKATILTSKIHKELNIKVPLAEVFKRQTIKAQAQYIKQAEENKYTTIEPVEKKEYYALSSAQQRMYFLQQMDLDSTAYNIPLVYHLSSDIEKDKLETTIKKLVTRHESLRTSFHMIDSEPVQRIHDDVELVIGHWSLVIGEKKPIEKVIRDFIRPFDLSQAPLLRSGLIKSPGGSYTWLVDMHHIISDGTSHAILTKDFISLYNKKELEPLPLHYKDFSRWQNQLFESGKIKSQEDYWLELYRDAAEISRPDLPIDYKRPEVFTFEGDHYGFMLDREDAAKFKALCHGNNGTLYMNILGALNALFYKYTGQEDIIIGSGIAGRPHAHLQRIIGMFVNTLAMRNYPKGNKTYEAFLKEVIAHSIKAFENQDVQFEELVDKLNPPRDPSRNPLFDISMVVQNFMDIPQPGKENLTKDSIGFKYNTTKFDMTFFIHESGQDIYINIEYYTAIFKKETIQRMALHFKNIIKAVVEEPSIKLKDINIISPEEKKQVLYQFNDTGKAYPKEKTIHELFEEQVERTPDYIAVVGTHKGTRGLAPLSALMSITYKELNQQSNQLAHYLYDEKHIQPQEPVGILMSQPIDLAVGILGILKAGAAYVPLEPSLPEERIKYMINDTCTGTVISEKRYIKTLDRLQWECRGFHSYLCMDSENIQKEEEKEKSELMDEELWNHVAQTAADEITGGGWVSSYTGEPFSKPEMDEYGDNILKKLEPLLHPRMRVLEIGIGSGITMYRIAPKVSLYYGTDLSAVMIDKNKKQAQQQAHKNIELFCLPAHEINKIGQNNFDLIIMNSVIQCFHGHHYLRKVIKQCIRLLAEKGYLFIGDIMDQQKKDSLVQEMKEYSNKGYKTKTDFSSELFVARGFWQDLAAQWDEIEETDFSRKIHTIENELTKFRYDTLITINKTRPASRMKKQEKQKYRDDKTRLLNLRKKTPACLVPSKHLAYIIYTSGTTGQPKGVEVEHRGAVNTLWFRKCEYQMNPGNVSLQLFSYAFDGFVTGFFTPVISGARVVLLDTADIPDVDKIRHAIVKNRVTHFIGVPPLYTLLLESLSKKEFSTLETVTIAGDKITAKLLEKTKEKKENLEVVNEYGVTEASVMSTIYRHQQRDDIIKIGHPTWNTRLYILDEQQPQPIGVIGELCIAGHSLARGYLNNPELTVERFRRAVISHWSLVIGSSKSFPNDQCPMTNDRSSKLYHTGDLARWLPDGNIEFLGRIDHQLKIRGFRIEPGEIENRLLEHDTIQEAIVSPNQQPDGDQYLCAYIVPKPTATKPEVNTLRKFLALTMPDYMIPLYFIFIDKIPLTPSGKVDRKKLPEPVCQEVEGYQAPQDKLQEKLVEIWSEVLAVERDIIGIHQNFFEIGGHSLKATILTSKIHKELNIKIPLAEVFKCQTIQALAEYIKQAEKNKYAAIEPVEKKEYYALSSAQKRMYFLQQLDLNSTAYNMPLVLPLDSDIKKDKLETTIKKLVNRHESLRTSIHTIDGMPVQRMHDNVEFEIEFYDLATEDTEDTERKNYKQITNKKETKGHHSSKNRIIHNSFIVRPFDLSRAPLLRSGLIKLPEDNRALIVDMHHIISDGTSHMILAEDFISLYNGDESKPLRLQYKDFSGWQNHLFESGGIKPQEDYWLELYSHPGEIPRLNLPTDYKRPDVFTFVGSRYEFKLEAEHAVKFRTLGSGNGATLYMNILAALDTLFYRYTNQEDIIIGSGIAGRPHADLQRIIGMFVNTLPVRNYPKGEKTYESFLKEVVANSVKAFENQDVQFEELVDRLELERDPSRNPLFDISMVVQNFMDLPQQEEEDENLTKEPLDFEYNTSKFDMTFFIYEKGDQVYFHLEYYTGIFKEDTIKRLVSHFKNVIKTVIEEPTVKLKDIDIISPEERTQLLYEFNNTAKACPRDKTIHQLFEEQAARIPDYIALVGDNEGTKGLAPLSALMSITYKQLNQQSNQLANYLYEEKHTQTQEPIGILMSQPIDLAVGILGILKANAAYVPLDPSLPEERIKYMINDACIGTVISEKRYIKTLNRLQWECHRFHSYLCMDSENIHREDEVEKSELMAEELWNHVGETATDEITGGGWTSSYTGEPLSSEEMDEYGDNIRKKLQPLLHPRMRVLEIGCASGITMYRIAPKVGLYYGTDLSDVITRKNKSKVQQEGHQNIKLSCLAAHEINQIQEKNFDLIIMNSVIQCFHGHNYLRKVIHKAIDLLSNKGCLFIGDIMDQEKKHALIRELMIFKNAHKDKNYKTKTDFSSELFVSRGFWYDLQAEFETIESVEFSNKIYNIENELSKFRYDTLLTINKHSPPGKKRKKQKYQDDRRTLSLLSLHRLASNVSGSSTGLAYIIYTSGTTGQPRGVVVEHQSAVNTLWYRKEEYGMNPGCISLQLFSYGFDGFAASFFTPIISGAQLVLLNPTNLADVDKIRYAIATNHVTHFISVPPLYSLLLESLTKKEFSTLKTITLAGDKITLKLVESTKEKNKNLEIVNEYGVTEASVMSTIYRHQQRDPIIKIGHPIWNTRVYILNESQQLQPLGAAGELCIAGRGLARGYLNNPQLTVERFCLRRPGGALFEKSPWQGRPIIPPGPPRKNFPLHRSYRSHMSYKSYMSYIYRTGDLARWLPDGNIEFLGRIDHQVKIRGFRIEPGEIESSLTKHDSIKEAVVIERLSPETGDKNLCAYIVPENANTAPKSTELKSFLSQTVPAYMIPRYFVPLEKIPLTPNGKLDRKKLPEPEPGFTIGDSYAPPGNETEEKLTRIWSELLDIEKDSISIESSFFDLGGHSLSLIRMKAKIKECFNKDIPVATMFRLPTISALSKYIQEEEICYQVPGEIIDESIGSMDETLRILEEYNDE